MAKADVIGAGGNNKARFGYQFQKVAASVETAISIGQAGKVERRGIQAERRSIVLLNVPEL